MDFIGVITSKKNEELLKKTIIQNLKEYNLNINIIVINEVNIENIKNVKFDSIIINEDNILISDKNKILKKILSQVNFLILNSDIYSNIEIIDNLKLNIITFGLNSKATLTASSIEKDNICISLQRSIKTKKGNIIEPKEISKKTNKEDVYRAIIGYILFLIYSDNK